LAADRRDQLIDPAVVAVEQRHDELRKGVVAIHLQHAVEEISNVGRGTVPQQRYRRVMPDQRVSWIAAERLAKHDERLRVLVCLVIHRAQLHGDLGVARQRPCLLDLLDRPVDLVRLVRPDPVSLPQETSCHEVPGAAPQAAAQIGPYDLPAHPILTR